MATGDGVRQGDETTTKHGTDGHEPAGHGADGWSGWKRVWQHGYFSAWVLLGTVDSLTGGGHTLGTVAVRLVLVGVLVGWYLYWCVPRRAGSLRPVLRIYLPGALAVWIALIMVDPAFLIAGFGVIAPLCMPYPLWAMTVVAAYGGVWLWQGVAESGWSWTRLATWALGAVITLGLIGYVAVLDDQGRKRQRLVEELRAAQERLADSERQAGILAERQRLARDIHDTLTQGFASIIMLLEAAQEITDAPPGGTGGRAQTVGRCLEQALRTARENLAESRGLVWAMRPAALGDAPLGEALDVLTRRLAEETGLHAECVITGTPGPVPIDMEATLVRIVQEAFANIRKHADADRVTVTVTHMDDLVVVDVHDNGRGFVPDRPPARGVGLAAMRERAEAVGGTLTIESAPGEGTTVVVSVPAARALTGRS